MIRICEEDNTKLIVDRDDIMLLLLGKKEELKKIRGYNIKIIKEVSELFNMIMMAEKGVYFSKVKIDINTNIALFLMAYSEKKALSDFDKYTSIDYEMIGNALLISILGRNSDMTEQLTPIFRKTCIDVKSNFSGENNKLLQTCNDEVIDYIVNNSSLKSYVDDEVENDMPKEEYIPYILTR